MSTGRSSTSEINTYKGQERALRANRLGTLGLLLSVIAASAPMLVVAGVMPTIFGVMGIVGQPLIYLILGVVLVLFSFGYAEMSRHIHNAGAFYAYIARGLGPTAGAGASVLALVAYNAMQFAVYGLLGFEVSSLFSTYLGISVAWWIPALATAAIIGVLGWLKIDLNAKVLGILLAIECFLVVVFDIATVANPGPQGLSMAAFDPSSLTGAGLGTALCFCVAAFVGCEAAPVYAEETSRPHVVVSRVMFL
ncbi:APC family permease, partial [Streptomyces sp. NPDC087850]